MCIRDSAGTTRPADEYMIKELMFEGSNRYFDQALCTGLNVTDEDIDALCKAMKEQAIKNAHNEEQKAAVKDVGRQQLRSWGVLIERDGKDYPSNAYAILTGCGGLHLSLIHISPFSRTIRNYRICSVKRVRSAKPASASAR